MSPAFSPFKIRIAAAAATDIPSCTECIEPPTIEPSKNTSRYEKMGALAAEESLCNAVLASCVTPAASTLIRCQKMAL